MNDQMTVTNGKIFSQARQLMKRGDLAATWSRLGKVHGGGGGGGGIRTP